MSPCGGDYENSEQGEYLQKQIEKENKKMLKM